MILLSFDIEEFDMPLEYGKEITLEDQLSISITGTNTILDLLKKHKLKATFFSTVIFAQNASAVMQRIVADGHEVASHGYYHSSFEIAHLTSSKTILQELTGQKVTGFRMPRMKQVSAEALLAAGYVYNSSINPTWLPGRYNNLNLSRTYFIEEGLLQLPASVSKWLRIPLFWLSFHNFPLWYYKFLVASTFKKDGYVNIYFHPWEFTDLTDNARFGFPGYVSKNSGREMISRMDNLMAWMNAKQYPNGTISQFIAKLT